MLGWLLAFYVLRFAMTIRVRKLATRNPQPATCNSLLTAHRSLLTVFVHKLHWLAQIVLVFRVLRWHYVVLFHRVPLCCTLSYTVTKNCSLFYFTVFHCVVHWVTLWKYFFSVLLHCVALCCTLSYAVEKNYSLFYFTVFHCVVHWVTLWKYFFLFCSTVFYTELRCGDKIFYVMRCPFGCINP